jgi:rhodanese-related sulfurtransferase
MVVYCAHGMRSLSATRFLQSVGFDVRSLAGGIVHWQAKGGKVGAP